MLRNRTLAAAFTAWFLAIFSQAADLPSPKIDKAKLEAFIRYTEGYTSLVKIAISDPTASAFQGFSRVVVHLSMGKDQRLEKVYFVSADGQKFVNGTVWDLNESPFLDTFLHLPADGPSFGPAQAPVTMVVFSDFECPYCREFAKTIRSELTKKYPNEVRVLFKDFPIESIHPWAVAASEASHCLGDKSPAAFWAFHDWIFEHQGEVNAANVREKTVEFAKTQAIDSAAVGACLDNHAKSDEVKASIKAAEALGVQQTPTFFLNGRLVGGALPWKSLDSVIQLELTRPKEVPGPTSVKLSETKSHL